MTYMNRTSWVTLSIRRRSQNALMKRSTKRRKYCRYSTPLYCDTCILGITWKTQEERQDNQCRSMLHVETREYIGERSSERREGAQQLQHPLVLRHLLLGDILEDMRRKTRKSMYTTCSEYLGERDLQKEGKDRSNYSTPRYCNTCILVISWKT